MKKYPLILLLVLFYFSAYSQQKDSTDYFSGEFGVSINKTNLQDENTEDRIGFGVSALCVARQHSRVNFVFGIEYNLTRQFKKVAYESHISNTSNIEYTLNNFSIPLNLRFNFGKTTKFIIEGGPFLDIILNSQREGTINTYLPDGNNGTVLETHDFKEKVRLSPINYGASIGMGISIPFDKFDIVVIPNYKLGLRQLGSHNTNIVNRYYRLTLGVKI